MYTLLNAHKYISQYCIQTVHSTVCTMYSPLTYLIPHLHPAYALYTKTLLNVFHYNNSNIHSKHESHTHNQPKSSLIALEILERFGESQEIILREV